MAIKEVVCESCEASFTIEYELLGYTLLSKVLSFLLGRTRPRIGDTRNT